MVLPEIVIWLVAKLIANPRNARTHTKKQISKLAKSLREFGWTAFIVIDEHGNILAGHARYEGWTPAGRKREQLFPHPSARCGKF